MLAIIDADSIAFAITASMDRQMQDDPDADYDESDISTAVSHHLQNIEEDTECLEYCMYLTGKASFRKQIDPNYKANRKATYRPPMLEDSKRIMVEEFGAEYAEEGFEADDEVGQVALDFWHREAEDECIICSIDKDLDTIPGWHYRWPTFNRDGKVYFVTEEEAMQSYWVQVLAGDPGDGIKGIPGIGPKKAEAHLIGCTDHSSYYDACEQAYKMLLAAKMPESEIMGYFEDTMQLLEIGKEGRENVYSVNGSD